MEVRDAVEDDADALAALADLPASAVAQLVHDRTVRVAEGDGGESDGSEGDDGSESGGDAVRGFVAYDAERDAVHVTQLAGDADAVVRLLDEPARFAEREGLAVEVLVPESERDTAAAVEDYGFEERGTGPRFEGEVTRRYRLER